MSNALTDIEDAARAGDDVDPAEYAAAKAIAELADLRRQGRTTEEEALRARAREANVNEILDAIAESGAQYQTDKAQLAETLTTVARRLVDLEQRRMQQIVSAVSRLTTLVAVGPGKPAQYWTGMLVDNRGATPSTHTMPEPAWTIADVLRRAFDTNITASIRAAL